VETVSEKLVRHLLA